MALMKKSSDIALFCRISGEEEMKMGKKVLLFGVVLCISTLLFACGNNGQPPTENVNEDVSTDAPASTTEGLKAMSGEEWPADLVGDLPKPEFETVSYEVGEKGSDFEGTVKIELKGMQAGDKYIETLVGLGYSSMTNMKIGEAVNFIGAKDDKSANVQVTYNETSKECSILYGGE